MSADFRVLVLAMAKERPNMRVATVVALALAVEDAVPDPDDSQRFGRWAANQPEVARLLSDSSIIPAIKELRSMTQCSLKQAKDAIDSVRPA